MASRSLAAVLTRRRDGRRGAVHANAGVSVESSSSEPRGGPGMPTSWSDKRERQYEHIKQSYEERGRSEDKAEELAARTVNKERREKGETKAPRQR
jgi:hypothetical protein